MGEKSHKPETSRSKIHSSTQRAEDLDSARLVDRFQAGDRDAFDAIYRRYFDRIFAYLRVVFKDVHEAEDVTQEVFLKALEALPRYERRRQPFRGWLFVIVRNTAISQLRALNRLEVEDPAAIDRRREAAGEVEPALDALNWITDGDLLHFIEHVPVPQRQVLLLRYMLDLDSAQIARIMDRTPADVRKLQHRAIEFLKDRLTAIGRAPEHIDRSAWQRRLEQAVVLRERRHALKP